MIDRRSIPHEYRGFKRSDVDTHSEMGRTRHPAVNIKVHNYEPTAKVLAWLAQEFGDEFLPWLKERCTQDWSFYTISEYDSWVEEAARDIGFEDAKEACAEIFSDYNVEVWGEGRSGGWLVVHGLPDIESWDAILIAKWGKFARFVKALVDDHPYRCYWQMGASIYEREIAEQERREERAAQIMADSFRERMLVV